MVANALEPLSEIKSEEQAQRLLQALKRDMPHSIQAINILEDILEWKKGVMQEDGLNSEVKVQHAVYRYEGDLDSANGDATMITVTKVNPYFATVCLHTTDVACTALRRVLANSSLVPWNENTFFDGVHERCAPVLLEEVRIRRGVPSPEILHADKMFLPKEEALQLDVSCPPGYVLRPLEVKHIDAVEAATKKKEWVDCTWPSSREWIKSTIARNPGLSWGAFPEGTSEDWPAAHIIGDGNRLRILHTLQDHRRLGLGSLVTRKSCRALAERGKDLHCNISQPNPASEANFKKLGFKKICECTYVLFYAPKSS